MNVEAISKILQLYIIQNAYSSDQLLKPSSSALFESILKGAMQTYDHDSSNSTIENSNFSVKNEISQKIEDAIKKACDKYGIDEDFIRAIIKQESGFNPSAVSKARAIGLMQLMPKTAESLGVNPFDILDNIDGGTRYIKNLLDAYDGNTKLALSAYNGGIGRMNRLGVDSVEEIDRMPAETRNYVKAVIKSYEKYKEI